MSNPFSNSSETTALLIKNPSQVEKRLVSEIKQCMRQSREYFILKEQNSTDNFILVA